MDFQVVGKTQSLIIFRIKMITIMNVFVTFFNSQCYIGIECFTSRIVSLMEAMQVSNRISTILHFGNPFVLEDVPHIPRVIVGTISQSGVKAALDVLAGNAEPKGSLTYRVRFR